MLKYKFLIAVALSVIISFSAATAHSIELSRALNLRSLCNNLWKEFHEAEDQNEYYLQAGESIGQALACSNILPDNTSPNDCSDYADSINDDHRFADATGLISSSELADSFGVAIVAQRDAYLLTLECTIGEIDGRENIANEIVPEVVQEIRAVFGDRLLIRGIATTDAISNIDHNISDQENVNAYIEEFERRFYYVVEHESGVIYLIRPTLIRLIHKDEYVIVQSGAIQGDVLGQNQVCPQPCNVGSATSAVSDAGIACPTPPEYARRNRDCMGPSYFGSYGLSEINPEHRPQVCDRHIMTPWMVGRSTREHQPRQWNQLLDTCRYVELEGNLFRLRRLPFWPIFDSFEQQFLYEAVNDGGQWTGLGYILEDDTLHFVGCLDDNILNMTQLQCPNDAPEIDSEAADYLNRMFMRYFNELTNSEIKLEDPVPFQGLSLVVGDPTKDISQDLPDLRAMLIRPRFFQAVGEESARFDSVQLTSRCSELKGGGGLIASRLVYAYFTIVDGPEGSYRNSLAPIIVRSVCNTDYVPYRPHSVELGLSPLGFKEGIRVVWSANVCGDGQLAGGDVILQTSPEALLSAYVDCSPTALEQGTFIVVYNEFRNTALEILFRTFISEKRVIGDPLLSLFPTEYQDQARLVLTRFFAHVLFATIVDFEYGD